jgi:hypothetical protein
MKGIVAPTLGTCEPPFSQAVIALSCKTLSVIESAISLFAVACDLASIRVASALP